MSEKKAYPLRISEPVLLAMQRWAADDLRSLNAQIEYVLRDALQRSGRLRSARAEPVDDPDTGASGAPATDASDTDTP